MLHYLMLLYFNVPPSYIVLVPIALVTVVIVVVSLFNVALF